MVALDHRERRAAAEGVGERRQRVPVHPQLAQLGERADLVGELAEQVALDAELAQPAERAEDRAVERRDPVAPQVELLE